MLPHVKLRDFTMIKAAFLVGLMTLSHFLAHDPEHRIYSEVPAVEQPDDVLPQTQTLNAKGETGLCIYVITGATASKTCVENSAASSLSDL